ncbi:MAG: HK97 family phage prohead protease [Candidatus Tectomicrobia bacterium]|nr:HK97 family phage prohead protease [Candidatus Tectomicrobia bacterium]
MDKLERRLVELRAAPEGRRLEGVAVRYGDEARVPWGRERIEAGAFAPIGDVILNGHHDRSQPLARTGAGLTLDDTAERLAFAAELPATRGADDLLALVRAGVVRGASVEMRVTAQRFEGGVRVIERAKLAGIGIVDTPAYAESEIEARRAALPAPAPRRRYWL